MKQVYFERDGSSTYSWFNGEIEYFHSMLELERFCIETYGHDYRLVEVTDDNWQGLYDNGMFDS